MINLAVFMVDNSLVNDPPSGVQSISDDNYPTRDEIAPLNFTESAGFRLVRRMNYGRWKRFWTFCQRHVGSLWIYLATYNLINVHGIEHFEQSEVDRPLVLVANHRSFFDMYTVSSVIFRRTKRPITLFFPVRAKFFYDNPLGWFVNLMMGWWSMYPPFFREKKEAEKRVFDKFSVRELIRICSFGHGNVVGFHPEGKRNLDGDPYSFLPAQTGIGKVIFEAHPQVIPVFIAGLRNELAKQVLGNWTGGEKVRVWFGEPIDLSEFYGKRNSVRTHKEISDFLMTKIGELGEMDRAEFSRESPAVAGG
ncbi:MAG: 1-acyl-sn-glycerol-3-phosphate acyltransferase [Saprospiraceae bacterium]|nr:1-acyl-sn-glycerol-3-phosphate acyltransferase [Pyrinomonadaceae bacterium]